jgi:hypothetical protein
MQQFSHEGKTALWRHRRRWRNIKKRSLRTWSGFKRLTYCHLLQRTRQ